MVPEATRGRRASQGAGARLDVVEVAWDAVAGVEPQALGLTYWFQPPAAGDATPVAVRFTGKRVGVRKPGPRDRFDVLESIDGVVPGSGPVALTTRVRNVAPGRWHVTASTVPSAGNAGPGSPPVSGRGRASAVGTTAFAPVLGVLAPGARVGAWSGLVAVGAVVALATQWLLASRSGLPPARVLLLSAVACVVGLAGAKLYYVAGHLFKGDLGRGFDLLTGGMCIQGFVLGAVATLVAGAGTAGVGVGPLLDVTSPGLLFGMTVGRFGCFFGGCCAGRATASRWGLWSSDRRLGMRRVPVQVLESALALGVGATALVVVWTGAPRPAGTVFVGAMAAYTLGRQLLFPLRSAARHTARGRMVATVLTALVLVVAVGVATAGS